MTAGIIRSNFKRFIGIDWSGAKDPSGGLQMAQCFPGTDAPRIVANDGSPDWRRREVLERLVQFHRAGEKILAGFDFAFAYPYCDEGAYFPGHDQTPGDLAALWELIDSICRDAPDFYGGPFYLSQEAPFSDYLLYQRYKGRHYRNRMRITDDRCAEAAGNPSSVFKCVGPESVGSGSVAGMRLLHHVRRRLHGDFMIWPFQRAADGRSVLVEIFPRLFYKLAGVNSRLWGNHDTVNAALAFFDSEKLAPEQTIETEDEADAIISAAALRHLAQSPGAWRPAGSSECARAYEGWIFGVT